jgi:hypothetical protein
MKRQELINKLWALLDESEAREYLDSGETLDREFRSLFTPAERMCLMLMVLRPSPFLVRRAHAFAIRIL